MSNPFYFLEPYRLNPGVREELAGRSSLREALLDLLEWKDILVIYGKSGVGKSSFVNHTLTINKLSCNWIPIRIIREINIIESLNNAIQTISQFSEIEEVINYKNNIITYPNEIIHGGILDALQIINNKWLRPIYLILDQIEEVFLLGTIDEKNFFIDFIKKVSERKDINVRILLIFREEHLGFVQLFETIRNGIFQDALYIDSVDIKEVQNIIEGFLNPENTYFTPKNKPERQYEEKNLEELKNKGKRFKDWILEENRFKLISKACTFLEIPGLDVVKLQSLLFILWEEFDSTEKNNKSNIDTFNRVIESSSPVGYYTTGVIENISDSSTLAKAKYLFILTQCISNANTKQPISVLQLTTLIVSSLKDNQNKDENYGRKIIKNQKNDSQTIAENLLTDEGSLEYQIKYEDVANWCEKLVEKKLFHRVVNSKNIKNNYYQLRHDTLVSVVKERQLEIPLRFPKKASSMDPFYNPYVGLNQYGSQEEENSLRKIGRDKLRQSFYGRNEIITEYIEFLRINNCLVIVGDSGTGKSSLVKAGILPKLKTNGYETKIFQPNNNLEKLQDEIKIYIERKNTQNICLYIDQFEECYTFRDYHSTNDLKNFLEFLQNTIIKKLDGTLKLIVTIRHDYAHAFDKNPILENWRHYKKLLRYPNRDEIFDIIVMPAFDKGVNFEPENLPDTIANEAANTSFFLPLLSFTMKKLYEKQVRNQNIPQPITDEAYKENEGIVGSLQSNFSTILKDLSDFERNTLWQLIPRLIGIVDSIPKSRFLSLKKISFLQENKTSNAHTILTKLVPDFLKIRYVEGEGECIEPIHDSLLIFIDEIRDVINPRDGIGNEYRSQIDFQPKIEEFSKKWYETINEENKEEKQSQLIITEWQFFEPLFKFIENDQLINDNWLFVHEYNLIKILHEKSKPIREKQNDQLKALEAIASFEKAEKEKIEADYKAQIERTQRENSEREAKIKEDALKKEAGLREETLQLTVENYKKQRKYKSLLALFSGLLVITIFILTLFSIAIKKGNSELNKVNLILKNEKKNLMEAIDEKIIAKRNADMAKNEAFKLRDYLKIEVEKKQNVLVKLESAIKEKDKSLKSLLIEKNLSKRLQKKAEDEEKEKASLLDDLKDAYALLEQNNVRIQNLLNSGKIEKVSRLTTLAKQAFQEDPALSFQLYNIADKIYSEGLKSDSVGISNFIKFKKDSTFAELLVVEGVDNYTFTKDGKGLITQRRSDDIKNSIIEYWDLINPKSPSKKINIKREGYPNIKYANNGKNENGKVILWAPNRGYTILDLESEKEKEFNEIELINLSISTEEKRIVLLYDNGFKIFDINDILINTTAKPTVTLPLPGQDPIKNAQLMLDENFLTVITENSTYLYNIENKKIIRKILKAPQTYFVGNSNSIISLQKRFLSQNRSLVSYTNSLNENFKIPSPKKDYNLIKRIVPTGDNSEFLIEFNSKELEIRSIYDNQKQESIKANYKQSTKQKTTVSSLFLLNIRTGKISEIENNLNYNELSQDIIASDKTPYFYSFDKGIVTNNYKLDANTFDYNSNPDTIARNRIFESVEIVNSNVRPIFLTHDKSGQLKLWEKGIPGEMDNRKQLYVYDKEMLYKITGIKL